MNYAESLVRGHFLDVVIGLNFVRIRSFSVDVRVFNSLSNEIDAFLRFHFHDENEELLVTPVTHLFRVANLSTIPKEIRLWEIDRKLEAWFHVFL